MAHAADADGSAVRDDSGYRLTAELSGISDEEIDVVLSDDTLTPKAKGGRRGEHKDKTYTCPSAPTVRDRWKIGTDFSNGVLTITMPKRKGSTRPERVSIART